MELHVAIFRDETGQENTGLHEQVAWTIGVMVPLETSFSASKDKLSVAKQYATVLDQRNAADLQLVSLRSSILALGTAHHAIATKSPVDFNTAVATINQQLAVAQKALPDLNQPSTAK